MEFLSYTPQLQRLMEALGLTLLHSLWQGLLLMLILWALLKLIRYQRANLRFGLALAALFLLLTAFAVTFYDQWENLKPVAAVSQELNAIDFPLTKPIVSEVEPTFWEQIQREANRIFFQLSENAVWMAGLWLLGSLFFSARLGLGLWQVRQLRQQRMPLPEHWQQVAADLQQKLGIRRRVNFSSSEQVETPLTLGWLRPLILLPSAMLTAMPTEQLESILVHELAHIRRHDYPWNLLQSLAEVILFYHPTYWYMASVLEQERELACDAITLQVTGRPQVYAQALLQVAALRTTFSPVALSVKGSARSRSGFGERIKRIVMPDYQKKSVQPLPFLLSFCLIGMLLFAFTLKSPVGEEEKQMADEIVEKDSLQVGPYLQINDGYGNVEDIENMPSTGEYWQNEINYAPSFEEVMQQVPDIVLDTSSLTIGEIYDQYVSLDQSLNTLQKSLNEIKGLDEEKVRINYSAPNVLYLLDGVVVDPKKVTRYEVKSMQVFPSHSVEGVDTSRYKMVVKAESRSKIFPKSQGSVSPQPQKTSEKAIQKNVPPPDSSIYDVMANKVFINISGQDAKFSQNDQEANDIKNSENRTYYHIDDPEVLFTLDGVATDPRTVKQSEVDNATFENENVPDGYLIEFKATSKKAAEAARKKEEKTIVRGTIRDQQSGEILPGANIKIKGTDKSTIADLSGRYQIDLPQGKGELVFSYVSYQDRTERIQNSKILNIVMFPEDEGETKPLMASGVITDAETGKPLPGTNILIKGTTTGTVSNREGAFQINIPEGGEELVIVHIGYEDEVISLEGKETINVSLRPLSAEAKQKRIEKLEKKRAERISRQLPALSSLDSTLIVVDGKARKDVNSLSELNIQPNEILTINVMGTETDLAKYLDVSDRGRYKKVIRILTKGYDANKRPTPPKDGKPLFIVDGQVREDIQSFEDLDNKYSIKGPHSISVSSISDVVVPSLNEEQLKQYDKVITIKTTKTLVPGDIESRIQGKVVDAESGEPIEGVKISDIHKREVMAVTDPTGEYRLVLDNPKEKVFIMYEAPGYRRYVVPACADCVVSSTFPSVLVFPMKKETEQKRAYKQESNVVRGQVVDAESGKPLPGINVLFKGSTTGTVSNPEGKFQIQIPEGGEELRFFFIGYEEEVVAVEGKENISISLKPLSEEEKKKQLDKLRQERAQENENTPLANSPLQSENIQGQVVDAETGQEIPGANILIKGTTIGTVSDMEGRYSLQLAEGAETLVISFIGYAKKEVSVEDASRIELQSPDRSKIPKQSKTSDSGLKVIGKITDSETGESLKGVRVFKGDQFIGRITHPTGIFTMPVQSFDDTLTFRKDGYRSVTVALNGRKKIDIALEKPSLNSALGGNVLYIVDGTPVENFDAASLGADEIRSLDVRKDEAAAQFMTPAQRERYDRVVIITTKRGNTLEEPTPENSFKVFPNPGNQEVKVRFNLQEAGQLEFQLLDKEGGFLRAIEQDFPNTGEQEISIPVDELPADTYFLRVKLNGKHETRRVIVQ